LTAHLAQSRIGPVLALLGGPPVRSDPWPRWPEHGPAEIAALSRVLESGQWGGYPAPGREATQLSRAFAEYVGARHVVLAANGTVTLEVILRAIGIEAGDEVIVPSLTWIATASAPVYLNAVPVFADVDRETLCIDPQSIESLITPKTKAIIPVHLGSAMADMDRILEIAEPRGLRVIEDCAHAHGARWSGKGAGTLGDAGSFSFQSSKLMTAGEGGAITTDSEDVAQRCQSLVNCGRKEPGYADFDGSMLGWNHRITELQAALLGAQLARLPEQKERRARNVRHFERRIAEVGAGLSLQKRDPRMTAPSSYEIVLLYDSTEWKDLPRDRFVEALEAEGVPADGAFYVPIQDRVGELFPLRAAEYPMIRERYGEALTPDGVSTPVASEAAYHRTIWLHHALFLGTERDVDDIVEAISKIRGEIDALL
jgi:L-glutamine:scyllo-inosose aminotransferase